jgi:hypothetical protein
MPEKFMLEEATLLLFPALMVFAAISDILTMTISNRVSIALVILFVGMAFACGLSATEIAWHLACGASTLVLTFFCSRAAGSAAAMPSSRQRRRSGSDLNISAITRFQPAFWALASRLLYSASENGPCQAPSRHVNVSPICWSPPQEFRMASPSPAPASCFIPAQRFGWAPPTRFGSATPPLLTRRPAGFPRRFAGALAYYMLRSSSRGTFAVRAGSRAFLPCLTHALSNSPGPVEKQIFGQNQATKIVAEIGDLLIGRVEMFR